MKNCEGIKNLLPDYLQGNLDEETRLQVQDHLQTCDSCQLEFETVGDLWNKMDLVSDEKPSENLKTNFYSMLSAYKEGLQQASSKKEISNRFSIWLEKWWPKKPALQFGFAVLFLVFGLLLGNRVFTVGQTNGEIAQLREELKNVNQLVSLSLLQQKSPSERLKGVSYTYQLSKPDIEVIDALVQTLNNDANVNVRLAAADALALSIDEPEVKNALIQSLLKQTYPLVQIELIDILVKTKEKRSINVFEELIQKTEINQSVRQHAQWGIQQLG